jgi:hypothetical protein
VLASNGKKLNLWSHYMRSPFLAQSARTGGAQTHSSYLFATEMKAGDYAKSGRQHRSAGRPNNIILGLWECLRVCNLIKINQWLLIQ